jgi:hypothetical protein
VISSGPGPEDVPRHVLRKAGHRVAPAHSSAVYALPSDKLRESFFLIRVVAAATYRVRKPQQITAGADLSFLAAHLRKKRSSRRHSCGWKGSHALASVCSSGKGSIHENKESWLYDRIVFQLRGGETGDRRPSAKQP